MCLDGKKNWQVTLETRGYKFVVNELMESPEYKRKYGTTVVPGFGACDGCW